MIEFRNLTVRYMSGQENYTALKDISLSIPDGEICVIIGPSGCGKSTLLQVTAGILKQYEGQVSLDGQPICPTKQKIGFMPQNYGLLPWETVAENIGLGLRIKGRDSTMQQEELKTLLLQLGLDGFEKRYPHELSGGQQQRVGLARAFALKPDLLLMDEPFSALDAITREEMQDVFLSLWQKERVATILVTHYVEEALYLGQKIVILSAHPGQVSQVLDNPLFGEADIRQKPEFFQMGLELRKRIKKDWGRE